MAYKIAILVGSLRKDSLNRRVANSMCAIRNDNLECEVVEIGTRDEVLGRPLHPYTEGLMRSIPVPWETKRGEMLGFIPGIVPRQTGERTQCGFIDRCPYAITGCAAGPVALDDTGNQHAMRCIRPSSEREPAVWNRLAEAS